MCFELITAKITVRLKIIQVGYHWKLITDATYDELCALLMVGKTFLNIDQYDLFYDNFSKYADKYSYALLNTVVRMGRTLGTLEDRYVVDMDEGATFYVSNDFEIRENDWIIRDEDNIHMSNKHVYIDNFSQKIFYLDIL